MNDTLNQTFHKLLKALKLPLPNDLSSDPHPTVVDPLEKLKLTLQDLKYSLKDLQKIQENLRKNASPDPHTHNKKNPEVQQALSSFSEELNKWDKQLFKQIEKHPHLAMIFAKAKVDGVEGQKPKKVKKKKASKKKNRWLSA